ncbi:MAG: PfkB family carbohydrate kinase [Erysipelotrichaceae bacterium]|nr:PfkB family carbohydrate kinase [Erysipelotrichaceae bacterium]
MKRVLLINDLSSLGKAALTVNIPIINSYGIETIPVPTMLLSAHTGFEKYTAFDLSEQLKKILNDYKEMHLHFDLIYTGFFANSKQIEDCIQIIRELKDENTLVFVDPILGENGQLFKCFNEEYLNSMKKLVKEADIISPNITEACLLTNRNINDDPIDIIKDLNNRYIALKSIRKEDKIGYLIKDDDLSFIYKEEFKEKLHGTGDVFASFLIGEYLNNRNFEEACAKAADITEICIKETVKDYEEHWYGLKFENYLKDCD